MNGKPEPDEAERRSSAARVCTYCKKIYIKICDGREDCPNRVWLDARRKESTKEATDG